MKKLLFVGDAAVPSGFARATHKILDAAQPAFDITVLGINYMGNPHDYTYPIYTCIAGGDGHGVGRLVWMCDEIRTTQQRGSRPRVQVAGEDAPPDAIIIQNDGWNFQAYVEQIRMRNAKGAFEFPAYAEIPIIALVAVDGKNFQGDWLNGIAHAVFWTEFALEEARKGGYVGPATVIPLGVDTDLYTPGDRLDARNRQFPRGKGYEKIEFLQHLDEAFLVGNLNRNQPRKRWDLTIRYFAEWVRRYKVNDAWLCLHAAPTGDRAINVRQLAQYYGIAHRIILIHPAINGNSEPQLVDTYRSFDLQITTTQGEGFGMTTFEGMACGIPQIVPAWSALGELTKDAVWQVPCTAQAVSDPFVNVIGGIADEELFIQALNIFYTHPEYRARNSRAGLERVQEKRFQWSEVAAQYTSVFQQVVG